MSWGAPRPSRVSGWGQALTGIGERDVKPAPVVVLETDHEYRARLLYTCGDPYSPNLRRRIETGVGEELDRIGEEYGLKRRGR